MSVTPTIRDPYIEWAKSVRRRLYLVPWHATVPYRGGSLKWATHCCKYQVVVGGRGSRVPFNFSFFSITAAYVPAQPVKEILPSATFWTSQAWSQAGLFPWSPRYIRAFIFIAHRVQRSQFAAFYQGSSRTMTRPANRFRRFSKTRGSSRVGSEGGRNFTVGSRRVRSFSNLTRRVGSP